LGELRTEIQNDDGLMGHGRNQKIEVIIAARTTANHKMLVAPASAADCW